MKLTLVLINILKNYVSQHMFQNLRNAAICFCLDSGIATVK